MYGTAWVSENVFSNFEDLELKKLSIFFLVSVLPHTFNKRITVYNIDK
jgi:hypothetical protein